MIELATTVILTVGSAGLFVYWFRYTCLLILSAKTTRDYAGEVATANQLSFLEVQSQLRNVATPELDRLAASLERDYSVLTYLLKNASQLSEEDSPLEARMLQMNYRLMSGWYRVSSRFSTEMGRKALEEMSTVVAHFANVMGERAACGAAA
jgi:hypothetical protein